MCNINIGLRRLSCVINDNVCIAQNYAINVIKDHALNGLRRQSQFDREFDLMQANDNSEIQDHSEVDEEEHKDEEKVITNILSKFHPPADPQTNVIHEEPVESSSSNPEIYKLKGSNVNEEKAENSLDFHTNIHLSIDILNEESEDEDNGKLMILNSKGEKPLNHNSSDIKADDENDSNYSPWVGRGESKLSPFQDYK